MLHRSTLTAAFAFMTLVGAAWADDGKKGAGDKASVAKEVCSCASCDLISGPLDALFEAMVAGSLPSEHCEGTSCNKVAFLKAHPSVYFGHAFAYRPSDVPALLEKVKARFADKLTTDEQETRMLDVISFFPDLANKYAIPALWESSAERFQTDHLMTFAAKGPAGMQKELTSRARKDVFAAAWLAARGDDVGRKTLMAAVKKLDVEAGCVVEPAIAAIGLASLGDGKALACVGTSLRDASLAALDRGELECAREIALTAEFVSKLGRSGKAAELGWCASRVASHCQERAADVASADQVFELLESLES